MNPASAELEAVSEFTGCRYRETSIYRKQLKPLAVGTSAVASQGRNIQTLTDFFIKLLLTWFPWLLHSRCNYYTYPTADYFFVVRGVSGYYNIDGTDVPATQFLDQDILIDIGVSDLAVMDTQHVS